MEAKAPIAPADFFACDIRVGRIVSAQVMQDAIRPAYVLMIDFGPLGILKSTAQLVNDYSPDELQDRSIVAVVNFPPKQVGKHLSQCLVLAAVTEEKTTLIEVVRDMPAGTPIA